MRIDKTKVDTAIINANPGIKKYLNLMLLLNQVDVASDGVFQKSYNGFYRVRRGAPWREAYFGLMAHFKQKEYQPSFDEVVDILYEKTNRCEASFASKMVATLNISKPIWDQFVLQNLHIESPKSGSKNQIEDVKKCYRHMENWYEDFLKNDDGIYCINRFNQMNPEYQHQISDIKKVDFILWQMR